MVNTLPPRSEYHSARPLAPAPRWLVATGRSGLGPGMSGPVARGIGCWCLLAHGPAPGASACVMSASGAHARRCQRLSPGVRLVVRSGHQPSEFLGRHGRRPYTGDLAFVHDGDPVRERVNLVEFGGDDEYGHAVVALLDDAAVHELDRAHVEPAGRLAGDEHLVLTREFPGQDHLLLVAAGQRAHRHLRRGGADVEFLDAFGCVACDRAEVEPDAGGEGRLVVRVEHHVVGHREVADQPVFLPVLGDVGDARVQSLLRRGVGQVPAIQHDLARDRGPQAHQRLAQLGLPVALHPGHAQDLARADLQGHPSPRSGRSRRRRSGRSRRAPRRRAWPAACSPATARSGRPSARRVRPRLPPAAARRRPHRGAAR